MTKGFKAAASALLGVTWAFAAGWPAVAAAGLAAELATSKGAHGVRERGAPIHRQLNARRRSQ